MDFGQQSLKMHREHNGKLEVSCKVKLEDRQDLSLAYTPGVAEPCKEIKQYPNMSFEYTCRGNMVAICTDGTRVLGLGNIGPEAAMPVMEGKAVLFKVFGDVDAVPVCIASESEDDFIHIVKALEPNYAGINLEDISSPKCYDIEDRLKKIMNIPVFHDDQHGTAIACLSAVLGALRFVKKDIHTVKIVVNGCGAAGSAIGRLLLSMGAQDVTMVTQYGSLYDGCDWGVPLDRIQQDLAKKTNLAKKQGYLIDVIKDADVLLGVSAPNCFTEEIIKKMAPDSIVFAMANPVPEISYHDAKKWGVRVAGTGRSDTPNQVNNVNVFPGVFRGAIDVRAREINEQMKVAAAYAIAELIDEKDLKEDYVVPDAFDPRVAPAVAAAVAEAAVKTGVIRVEVHPDEIRRNTAARIERNKKKYKTMRDAGLF